MVCLVFAAFPLTFVTAGTLIDTHHFSGYIITPVAITFLLALVLVTIWSQYSRVRCGRCDAWLGNHLKTESLSKPILFCPYCGVDLNEP